MSMRWWQQARVGFGMHWLSIIAISHNAAAPVIMMYSITPQDQMSATLPSYDEWLSTCSKQFALQIPHFDVMQRYATLRG